MKNRYSPYLLSIPAAIGIAIVVYNLLPRYTSPLPPPPLPSAPALPASAAMPQEASTTFPLTAPLVVMQPMFQYVEIVDSCGPVYQGDCVVARAGPGAEYPVVARLRNGMVLRIVETVVNDEHAWYKIRFDDGVRYPERITEDWYVSAEFARLFMDDGEHVWEKGMVVTSAKRIVVDVSEQMLYAYDGDVLFMQEHISTGLEFTPTPRGTFTIFKMTPSRYMQGPLPGVSDQYYDLPGVPWDLYFTHGGAVIHGAYWHDKFGQQWSHGCVNLPPEKAKELYLWAEIGIPVTVQE